MLHCAWDCGKTLPHFTVGDYVLVDRVSRKGKRRKLRSPWPGPWRVANDDQEHVDAVQHLVNCATSTWRGSGFTLMTSSSSPASSSRFPKHWLNKASSHPEHLGYQAGCMRFGVKVAWEGLSEAESTWDPVSRVFHDAPAVMHK